MKPNWTTGLVSELIRSEKVMDDNAETIQEISFKSSRSLSSAERDVAALLKAGKIEQVWKKYNGRTVKAYRLKHEKTAPTPKIRR